MRAIGLKQSSVSLRKSLYLDVIRASLSLQFMSPAPPPSRRLCRHKMGGRMDGRNSRVPKPYDAYI
jgi:hypothetical protein